MMIFSGSNATSEGNVTADGPADADDLQCPTFTEDSDQTFLVTTGQILILCQTFDFFSFRPKNCQFRFNLPLFHGFQEKRQFLAKIAGNSDNYIDPRF
jgi:hypothetical protein